MDAKNQPEIGDPVFDGASQVGNVGHVYSGQPNNEWSVLVDGLNDRRNIELVDLHEDTTQPARVTGQHFELA